MFKNCILTIMLCCRWHCPHCSQS